MFYVVYLVDAKKYLVIPCSWLRDGEGVILEKFVDYGLNSNQKHLCYWSRHDGVVADFGIDISTGFPCRQDEACYYCFVLKFRGECFIPYSISLGNFSRCI